MGVEISATVRTQCGSIHIIVQFETHSDASEFSQLKQQFEETHHVTITDGFEHGTLQFNFTDTSDSLGSSPVTNDGGVGAVTVTAANHDSITDGAPTPLPSAAEEGTEENEDDDNLLIVVVIVVCVIVCTAIVATTIVVIQRNKQQTKRAVIPVAMRTGANDDRQPKSERPVPAVSYQQQYGRTQTARHVGEVDIDVAEPNESWSDVDRHRRQHRLRPVKNTREAIRIMKHQEPHQLTPEQLAHREREIRQLKRMRKLNKRLK